MSPRLPSPPRPARAFAFHNAHPRLRFSRATLASALRLLDAHAARFQGGCPAGELSVAFLTDPALAGVHGAFMNDPSATDVITFEGDAAAGLAGEICVSVDTAARFVGLARAPAPAGKRGAAAGALAEKFSAEITLYVVHGWLHLAGYDDLQPAKKRRMRAAEKRAFSLLRRHAAMPEFVLR